MNGNLYGGCHSFFNIGVFLLELKAETEYKLTVAVGYCS